MNNELYKKVEGFVLSSFAGKDTRHYTRTADWIKELKPEADLALLIAGVSHDIERAFRDASYNLIKDSAKGFQDGDHLQHHQEKGAEIMAQFLAENGADTDTIGRVKILISKHEVGGNEDQNLLKDVDSLSFFENNVDFFVKEQTAQTSREKVKEKFDWMFGRITLSTAYPLNKREL